ncbi:hypothetical protein F4813DRAFT_24739 [Daldinia decipiens]|uniref:uncharacterized protein n=1 Tax=Daldinia decipiens TaxID=326647 RepID=UPI0020C4E198|nr:uncharacterized protein F4813DRAFT_24739 [Daldinia decipiens]KAI1659200.1 hypothetical protein F4813DRAFT_24739 [Daldinia decipiens]
MKSATNLVSRIVYNSIYLLLCLLLAALFLIVPGDFIRQDLFSSGQYINLIVLAIVFVLTVLIVLFIYILRLYVTRTVLASIPKTWIPIEKGDVPKEVRKVIATDLGRSAAIALGAHPKVIAPVIRVTSLEDVAEEGVTTEGNMKKPRRSFRLFKPKSPATVEEQLGISFPPLRPVWGEIEHDGWGSPSSPDLPDVQYSTVLSELPNLIEAKAVSQAPMDPTSAMNPPMFDADSVSLLQRRSNMTMRDYVMHLMSVGVLLSSPEAFEFLDSYERARFSTRPMSNAHFRQLMHLFAELLRAMQPLDAASLYESRSPNDAYSESDGHIDDDAPRDTNPTTPARSGSSSLSLSGSSTRSRTRGPALPDRNSSTHTWHQYRTAPTTPRSKFGGRRTSQSTSSNNGGSFTQTRRPYPASRKSSASFKSASQSSIIRLATREDRGDLPYVLRIGESF